MEKKIEYISRVTEGALRDAVNEFLERKGPRWRVVTIYRFGEQYVYHTAWLEFEDVII